MIDYVIVFKKHTVSSSVVPIIKDKSTITNEYFYYSLAKPGVGMSGGNLNRNRSRSLADVGVGPDAHRTESTISPTISARSMSTLSAASEEEGHALLGQHSYEESTGDERLDTALLDYDSDGNDASQFLNASELESSNRNQVAAMDTGVSLDCEGGEAARGSVTADSVMDPMYYQCRSARLSCQKDTLISISIDDSFGKRVIVNSPNIGSLEDHGHLETTFHGSRVMRGNTTVNESLSSSFDPAKMVCISCENDHQILGNTPVMFLFSDQNFVATVPGPNKDCLNVVRVENATLLELVDVSREILGNAPLPEGSILMLGSASHLSRMGTSAYARDWAEVVALCNASWHGIRVCPLIPLIVTGCPGTIVRELSELSTWLDMVYDGNPQGLQDVWRGLIAAMDNCSNGSVALEVMESYKILLPESLENGTLTKPVTFCSSNSRPMTFTGLSKDSCSELLGLLLNCSYASFRACSRPEMYLARTAETYTTSEIVNQKVTLVGASNLKNAKQFFVDNEIVFDDVSVPGWTPTADNVKTMSALVEKKAKESSGFVFDIFGNGSVRFEQFDGSTAMPFKSGGTFHLGGRVTTTPLGNFRKLIELVLPVLRAKGTRPCTIVPPLPRYVFSRCCSDSGHCTNMNETDFPEKMLAGFVLLRQELIRQLVQHGLTEFKVLDSCCNTDCITTASVTERLNGLRIATAKDGVHLTPTGYSNLAGRATNCLKQMLATQPRTSRKNQTFFWRGFRSVRGSSWARSGHLSIHKDSLVHRGAVRGSARGDRRGHARRPYHPYKRW